MTATQTQIRRDTAANLAVTTPASSELAHDTTNNRVHIGDGLRSAGWQLPNFRDIQKKSFGYASAGGTANALTITLTPPLLAYGSGVEIDFLATANNTGAATANVNGLGARTIVKLSSGSLVSLAADDIISGCRYTLADTGSQFILRPMAFTSADVAGSKLLAVVSGGGASYDFTSLIDTTYKNYLFVLESLIPTVSGGHLLLRVRRSGQGSFDAGSSNYVGATQRVTTSGATASNAGGTSLTLINSSVSNVAPGASGCVYGHGLALSDYGIFNGQVAQGLSAYTNFAGGRNSTSPLDGVQFLFSTGNITSGTVYMYGLKKTP